VALIQDLVDSGHAYERGGDVYFRVASFDDYGKLSNRPLEEMQQGEGDDAAELKEAPQDFALWKAHKEGEDTSWETPWGRGRPGWHIECSAMAEAHYRKPVAYTEETLEDAARAVGRVRELVRRLGPEAPPAADLDALADR